MYVFVLKDKPSKTKTLNTHKHLGAFMWMAISPYLELRRLCMFLCSYRFGYIYSEYMQHCSPGTFQFCRVLNVAVTTPYHAMEWQKYMLILLPVHPRFLPSHDSN